MGNTSSSTSAILSSISSWRFLNVGTLREKEARKEEFKMSAAHNQLTRLFRERFVPFNDSYKTTIKLWRTRRHLYFTF